MNKVVHFEIPADDMERAKKFYSDIFGWEIQDIPAMQYTTLTTVPVDENRMPKEAGAINGGMAKRMQKGESPVLVISVSSVDEYIAKVEKGGGKITMQKMQVGSMGFYAKISDTEGNVLGIWQDLKQS